MLGFIMTALYKHQKNFLALNPNKSSLVWSCGTGKTRTAIEWAGKIEFGKYTLIICPKALKTNWEREIQKSGVWFPFTPKVITKEEFRRDWDGKLPVTYDQIIVDEVHNGFLTPMFKSKMSKALKKYLHKHKVPRVLLLSATVYTSSPWNIFNLAFYTGHIWDWRSFRYEFFNDVRFGMRVVPVAKKGIEPRLAELTRQIASVVDIHDVMDVPLQNHLDPEYFALSKEQQKAIKDNYDPLPIVRYTAQHEIENGILLSNEFRTLKFFEYDKEERILQLCTENKKIALVCRYTAQMLRLCEILKKYNVYAISGQTEDRDKIVREAEASKDCVVVIQGDCGIGFELPSFELCVYVSMSYSYTSFEQMNGRFLRMNAPSRTTFIYLLTEGESIDQAVYDAVKRREDFKIQLYEKNR